MVANLAFLREVMAVAEEILVVVVVAEWSLADNLMIMMNATSVITVVRPTWDHQLVTDRLVAIVREIIVLTIFCTTLGRQVALFQRR